jgi:hypothetical protein
LGVFVLPQPFHMGEENLIREVGSVFFWVTPLESRDIS